MPPSASVFYFEAYDTIYTCSSIARMEDFIKKRLGFYAGPFRIKKVIFDSDKVLPMSDADIAINGWTVVPAAEFTPHRWINDQAMHALPAALTLAPVVPVERRMPHEGTIMDILEGKV